MATLTFKDLSFKEAGNKVEVTLLNNFYFFIEKSELSKISSYEISQNSIEFKGISENKASKKFNFLLFNNIKGLKSRINNKKSIYIHQNSGIPLIGTNYFGLVDRNTSIIEVKPITGCNLNCIYCSVDEGRTSKRQVDFVVEKDYIVDELRKLADFKAVDGLEAHINAQGETLLYPEIVELVADIAKIRQFKAISIDTNGALLTRKLVDELAEAGLTRFNLSLNALDSKIASKMAGCPHNVDKVVEIAKYIPKKTDLIIAPLYLPGYNDEELPKLAKFALEIGAGKDCPPIGIQNFLPYKLGRNPVKGISMDDFYDKLRGLEKEFDVKLIFEGWSGLKETKPLPKPFKKGDLVKAAIVCDGRLKYEKLAVSHDRVISIPNCHEQGQVKLRITRTKHNIFIGTLV